MNSKDFQKRVENYGWKLTVKPDFRRQDAVLYYEDNLAIEAKKGDWTIQAEAIGDIRIYGNSESDKHGYMPTNNAFFIFKGGKPAGKLTNYLRKHGRWENNNWFEIFVFKNGKQQDFFSDVSLTLNELVDDFAEALHQIN